MINAQQLEALKMGDLIETTPLLAGLCSEPLVLKTVKKDRDIAEFVVTYFGVTLGRWRAVNNGGTVDWSFQ